MIAKVNEVITGEYDHLGKAVIYGDTDSVVGSTIIETSAGPMKIEDLFNQCQQKYTDASSSKEYGYNEDIMVLSYDNARKEPYFGHINYVYKHSVKKKMFEIEDEFGNIVTVTEDHSVMVERNSELIEVKPSELLSEDILISVDIR